MVLLKPLSFQVEMETIPLFTFHYGLIKTILIWGIAAPSFSFTFHYGLIKTIPDP